MSVTNAVGECAKREGPKDPRIEIALATHPPSGNSPTFLGGLLFSHCINSRFDAVPFSHSIVKKYIPSSNLETSIVIDFDS